MPELKFHQLKWIFWDFHFPAQCAKRRLKQNLNVMIENEHNNIARNQNFEILGIFKDSLVKYIGIWKKGVKMQFWPVVKVVLKFGSAT